MKKKRKQTKKAKKESKKIQPTIGKNNREKNKGEGLPQGSPSPGSTRSSQLRIVARTDSWRISVSLFTELNRDRQSCARGPIDISQVLKSLVCQSACLSVSLLFRKVPIGTSRTIKLLLLLAEFVYSVREARYWVRHHMSIF